MLPTIAATRVTQFVSILFSLPRNFELVETGCWKWRHGSGVHCRLEPVIIELERQRSPVVVIAHQVSTYPTLNPKPPVSPITSDTKKALETLAKFFVQN
jgi:hypothetical protein